MRGKDQIDIRSGDIYKSEARIVDKRVNRRECFPLSSPFQQRLFCFSYAGATIGLMAVPEDLDVPGGMLFF